MLIWRLIIHFEQSAVLIADGLTNSGSGVEIGGLIYYKQSVIQLPEMLLSVICIGLCFNKASDAFVNCQLLDNQILFIF